MNKLEKLLEWGGTRKEIVLLVISAVALVLSLVDVLPLPFDPAWVAIILCGVPIILEAVIGVVTRFDITADVLVSIALIASVCIGEYFAAGEVACIMQLGGLLEDLTVAKSRAGIESLVHLSPRTARLLKEEEEIIVPAEEVQVDDRIRVLPGETVPVDGVIISGQTSINQSVMTGESLPVDKMEGDEVFSGTVNQFGSFDMKATKVGEDSSIQRMIRLVQSADAGKAKIVGVADRWATWIVVIALAAAGLTWLISGEVIRAVTILVVFCPCALVLATPTAITAAIGNVTKHGILVREGDALERLAQVSKVTFDKTGTLTMGKPEVVAVVPLSPECSEEGLFAWAAGTELRSEHPLGKAVVESYQERYHVHPVEPDEFQMLPGEGVSAVVRGKRIQAGNGKLVSISPEAEEKSERYLKEGCTIIWISADEELAGFLALADTLRPDTAEVIQEIRKVGVEPVLLTGDAEQAAGHIAGEVGISEVHARCLPEDKLEYIRSSQEGDSLVCMIGDGVNDAPALKAAHVGIAMGGIGSDIAVDAADIALVKDDIRELPHLLSLSKHMMKTIRLNMTFSMTLNVVAIILAILGILNTVVGALVHNCGSVLVIVNSALLLNWKQKPNKRNQLRQEVLS